MIDSPQPFGHSLTLALALTAVLSGKVSAQVAGDDGLGSALDLRVVQPELDPEFGPREVEHLLNRAGFGGNTFAIRKGVKAGQQDLVRRLVAGDKESKPYRYEPVVPNLDRLRSPDEEIRRRERNRLRTQNRDQAGEFLGWWVGRMVQGENPLRERMTLFWHGFFTSDVKKVRLSNLMIDQNELFRRHALGNYGALLGEVLRDPAMLIYLDNISNTKGNPNENLARELMELFSLGEGNYTEEDIREVARALTGYGIGKQRQFQLHSGEHDFGAKTILGQTGRHDAGDVVDILLDQPACARWVAGSIITYLEGTPPSEERLGHYASLLREEYYELAPMLTELFTDPMFYRPEVVGARVSSPIDFLVGSCRRLGADVDGQLIVRGAGMLGMSLFEPPNVKGWNEGLPWVTTATLMNRGNLMGVLLGTVAAGDMLADPLEDMELTAADMESMEEMGLEFPFDGEMAVGDEMMMEANVEAALESAPRPKGDIMAKVVRTFQSKGKRPSISFAGRIKRHGDRSDQELVEYLCSGLLAIEAPLETQRMLVAALRSEREAAGVKEGKWHRHPEEADAVFRKIAHLILSLPEAQLG